MVKKWFVKAFVLTFLFVTIAGSLWLWGAVHYVYSKGDRAGYVQKFSNKGWLIKTWEGELAMVNLPGAMPEIFYFSVRNPAAVEEIRRALGQRIVLEYNEHRFLPPRVFGDTRYFITKVRGIEDAPTPATSAVPAKAPH